MMRSRGAGIVILLLSITPSLANKALLELDHQLSMSLQGDNSHPVLDYTMEGISLVSPLIEVGWIGNLWSKGAQSYDGNSAHMTVTTLVMDQVTIFILKYSIGRERPHRNYQPRLWNTRITPSFPSGHVSSTAVIATIAAHRYRHLTLPMVAYTLASAYSQVYVGNHYISDVVGGVVLGVLVGKLVLARERNSGDGTPGTIGRMPVTLTLSIALPSNNIQ